MGGIVNNSQFGDGQTLSVNLYGVSRSYGVPYTNNTGKPIIVYLGCSNTVGVAFTYTVNGVSYSPPTTGVASAANFTFVVPNNATYSISITGSAPTLNMWQEFK